MSGFPFATTTFRVERHTRAEPYEPAQVSVLDHLDGTLGRVQQDTQPDGGDGERITLRAPATLPARAQVERGMVLVDGDGNTWNVGATHRRTALGRTVVRCDLYRVVGAAT